MTSTAGIEPQTSWYRVQRLNHSATFSGALCCLHLQLGNVGFSDMKFAFYFNLDIWHIYVRKCYINIYPRCQWEIYAISCYIISDTPLQMLCQNTNIFMSSFPPKIQLYFHGKPKNNGRQDVLYRIRGTKFVVHQHKLILI